MTGSRPTNSGISPNFEEVLGLHLVQEIPRHARSSVRRISTPKPIPFTPMRRRMMSSSPTNAPPQMKRMFGGVDLQELLLRVLAATLGRHAGGRPLDDLEQRLLHALAGDVAGDRRVVALARDLVDLVDVDDAALRLLDVVVGVLQQR